ncbi:hypothetical protein [Roseovarius aestuariivivens]|uniref:hypothetical protein n=1 Tax=Roseovarius aestuariivivens TaxID=1888910 RepID=UPI0010808130|nr:hypothetical protein [Roseovarius aestuariivivens]
MSSLKTIVVCLVLWPLSLQAGQRDNSDIALQFSGCLGRYAAQVAHDHLMRRDAQDDERRLRTFAALLDAVPATPLPPATIMAHRIDAKMRFADLLRIAEFHTDPQRAARAARLVRRHLRACETLVLG